MLIMALFILNTPTQDGEEWPLRLPDATVHITKVGPPINKVVLTNVLATGYNSLANQTDNSPFITATMDSVFWGGIAVCRPLLEDHLFPYGSIVKIEGYDNLFIVFDTMNIRYKKPRIDLWYQSLDDAWDMGVDTLTITKVGMLPKHLIKVSRPVLLAMGNKKENDFLF